MRDRSLGTRRPLVAGLVAAGALLLLTACSGTLVPTPTPTPTPAAPAETPSAGTETPDAGSGSPSPTAAGSPGASVAPVSVELGVDTATGAAQFSYVQAALEAPAGSTIKLVLSNTTNPDDEIGHNWVLVQPGQEDAVLASGVAAGDDRDWLDDKDPGIIAASKLIEGNERNSVSFAAPPPGTYTFLCTFPKHYAGGMKGTLTIH
jgi:azurin